MHRATTVPNGFVLAIALLLCPLQPIRAFTSLPSTSLPTPFTTRRTTLQMTNNKKENLPSLIRRGLLLSTFAATAQLLLTQASTAYQHPGFTRIRTKFIAALGDPNASSGNEASEWGIWNVDPGPRGVFLDRYNDVLKQSRKAPAGWTFDPDDWWVEEHGLIMEQPDFPLKDGRYLVTGGRSVTTVLEVGKDGSWKLEEGKLYDVTHLPCRSARYRGGSPEKAADMKDFPVRPGAVMPEIEGSSKKDYAVLFVIGVGDDIA